MSSDSISFNSFSKGSISSFDNAQSASWYSKCQLIFSRIHFVISSFPFILSFCLFIAFKNIIRQSLRYILKDRFIISFISSIENSDVESKSCPIATTLAVGIQGIQLGDSILSRIRHLKCC